MPITVILGHFPGGWPYIEYLPTLEMDPAHVLMPDGLGGVGWVPVGVIPGIGGMLMWGANDIGTVASALFLLPGYGADTNATAVPIELRVPRAGTLKNLHIRQNVLYGAIGEAITYEIMKNGAPTGITVTITGMVNDGADLVHSVPVAQGDRLTVRVTKSSMLIYGLVLGVVATTEFD
jgi:hypothetical protein